MTAPEIEIQAVIRVLNWDQCATLCLSGTQRIRAGIGAHVIGENLPEVGAWCDVSDVLRTEGSN